MTEAVKRRYDNSRRQAQVRATRLKVIEAAKRLFTDHGYPATTIETIAQAADVPLPTVYRMFGSKRALLAAVLDTSFGGDDQPIAFGDRPAVRAARAETDPAKMVTAFARIAREFMDRSSAILHVLATAAQVDPDAAGLLAEIRRQRHVGQSRIITALDAAGALDPGLDTAEAADIVYALLSPDVHRILTIERGWPADRYERWIARSLATLLSGTTSQASAWPALLSRVGDGDSVRRSMGWPVTSAMRSKSLSRCNTVSPVSSAVAAIITCQRRHRTPASARVPAIRQVRVVPSARAAGELVLKARMTVRSGERSYGNIVSKN
jgi:TetR/AcrR family transcriptional regulator, regulator of autoinduction and epiphytic fitness